MEVPLRACLLALAITLTTSPALGGGQPHVRTVTSAEGLPLGQIHALAQDDRGTLWIGSYGGVHRWDGLRAVQADGNLIREEVRQIEVDAQDRVFARTQRGNFLWQVDGEQTRRVIGPDGAPIEVNGADVDASGRLVVLSRGSLLRLRGAHWEFLSEDPVFRHCQELMVLPTGGLLVLSRTRVWHLEDAASSPRLWPELRFRWQKGLTTAADGTLWMGDRGPPGRVLHADLQGRLLDRIEPDVGGIHAVDIDLEGTLWIAGGSGLRSITADGTLNPPTSPDLGAGGDLLVDSEGTLWLASWNGLSMVGIPSVRTWNTAQGLRTDLVRGVHVHGDDVYVGTWHTPGWIDRRSGEATTLEAAALSKNQVCTDGTGMLWTSIGAAVHEPVGKPGGWVRGLRDGELAVELPAPLLWSYIESCSADDQGVAWMTVDSELWGLRGDDPPIVRPLPFGRRARGQGRSVYVHDDTIYVSAANAICHTSTAALQDQRERWTCTEIPAPIWIHRLLRTEAGRLWAASKEGVYAQNSDESWALVPGLTRHSSEIMTALTPASEGGFWVGGHALLLRIRDAPDLPDGYEVIADLTGWIGPQVATFRDLTEDADGGLWIAHSEGVTVVPRSAQHPVLTPPPVFVREARLDGRRVPDPNMVLPFPTDGSVLRVIASTPSYRTPALLRFRTRIDDRAWSEPVREGIFELQGLPAGRHELWVAASLDGQRWSDAPARVTVLVPVSWYARIELWFLLSALVGVTMLFIQRTRARFALRVERLRTRIAMDLHDEVGAGLGAIGLLGSVLRRDLPSEAVRSVGDDIAETSSELSDGLRAIVWSMRPSSQSLDQLGAYLADRARISLTEVHDHGHLTVEIDEAASRVHLSLEVLRAAQLVGLEALHNVAKHAHAEHVRLAVEREGRAWRIVIEDDGDGIDPARQTRLDGGIGLASMQARAQAVGGRLHVDSTPDRGTRVVLWLPRGSGLLPR